MEENIRRKILPKQDKRTTDRTIKETNQIHNPPFYRYLKKRVEGTAKYGVQDSTASVTASQYFMILKKEYSDSARNLNPNLVLRVFPNSKLP